MVERNSTPDLVLAEWRGAIVSGRSGPRVAIEVSAVRQLSGQGREVRRLARERKTLAAEGAGAHAPPADLPAVRLRWDDAGRLDAIAQNDTAAPERVRDHHRLSAELFVGENGRLLHPADRTTVPTGGQVR